MTAPLCRYGVLVHANLMPWWGVKVYSNYFERLIRRGGGFISHGLSGGFGFGWDCPLCRSVAMIGWILKQRSEK